MAWWNPGRQTTAGGFSARAAGNPAPARQASGGLLRGTTTPSGMRSITVDVSTFSRLSPAPRRQALEALEPRTDAVCVAA
jgi:hypothetical protein